MDMTEFSDYYQSPSSQMVVPQMEPSLVNQSVNTLDASSQLPSFSTLCSDRIQDMLNALFPDDDTLKSHLNYPEESAMQQINDFNMDIDPLPETFLENSRSSNEQISPNRSPYNYEDIGSFSSSNSILETLDQILNSSFNADTTTSQLPTVLNQAPPNNAKSPTTTNEPLNDLQEATIYPSKLRRPFTDLLSNNLSPLDSEFKPTLSLNTDCSKVKEPWRPSVGKKILSAYYTPLSLKSEFLATQTALDEFQSLALKEAIAAFHDVAFKRNKSIGFAQTPDPNSCSSILVETCAKVRAYRRLYIEDKITLLSDVFFDIVAIKSVLTYDHLTDSWSCSGARVDRRKVWSMDQTLHNSMVHIIETFPDRWRKDLTAASLIYLIGIFNPDLPNLKFNTAIRYEQYSYIYLLKRYLETVCETQCDASDHLYQLMVKIEDIQKLRRSMVKIFDSISAGYVSILKDRICTLVKSNELT